MHQDLNDLYYYVQVLDHGGFSQAGRALGIPKSKLSRRIALLEERLGVRLIQRSTRSFAVTELGQAYYTRCKAMLVEADAAQKVIESTSFVPLIHPSNAAMTSVWLTYGRLAKDSLRKML